MSKPLICPHCRVEINITKRVRQAVLRWVSSQPRPRARGPARVEICRKAGLAAAVKRWGYVVGAPTKLELKAQGRAQRKAERNTKKAEEKRQKALAKLGEDVVQDLEAGPVEGENKNREIDQAGVDNP